MYVYKNTYMYIYRDTISNQTSLRVMSTYTPCMYICIHLYIYKCMHRYTHICTYTCMYRHIICGYVHTCLFVHVYIFIHINVYNFSHEHVYTIIFPFLLIIFFLLFFPPHTNQEI